MNQFDTTGRKLPLPKARYEAPELKEGQRNHFVFFVSSRLRIALKTCPLVTPSLSYTLAVRRIALKTCPLVTPSLSYTLAVRRGFANTSPD